MLRRILVEYWKIIRFWNTSRPSWRDFTAARWLGSASLDTSKRRVISR